MSTYNIKEFFRKNYRLFIVGFLLIFAFICYLMTTNVNFHHFGYKWWFDGLSDKEVCEYLEGDESGFSDGKITHYNVIGVGIDTESGFTRLDCGYVSLVLSLETKNGQSLYYFTCLDQMNSKIIKGDKDMLVIDERYYEEYKYLQLTQSTLNALGITDEQLKQIKASYWYIDR